MQGVIPKHAPGYYLFERFKENGCIAAFSYSKKDMGFNNNPGLKDNRSSFLERLGIDCRDLVCLRQVHADKVFLAEAPDRGRGAFDYTSAIDGYDAIVTSERNIPLAVFTADCLSVFIFDLRRSAAGIVHAGWRGTKGGIVSCALKFMKNNFSSRPQDIICAFGPGIRSCCYEVGWEFKNHFPQGLIERGNKIFLDLAGLNYSQLVEAGVPVGNITDPRFCTFCQKDDFFSYRREGPDTGRMMSVIMLA